MRSFPCPPSRMAKFLPPPTRASPFTENRRQVLPPSPQSQTRPATRRTAISPGSLISIFGSNLAAITASAPSIPLPMSIADTSVTVNGVPAPLLYESPGQINAQVPWEVPAGPATVVVRTRGASSAPVHDHHSAGRAWTFHRSDRQRRGAQCRRLREFGGKPAAAGSVISVFFTGQGPVTTAVDDGAAPAAGTTYSATSAASATIGGTTGADRICRAGSALPRRRADESKSTCARERSLSADRHYRREGQQRRAIGNIGP